MSHQRDLAGERAADRLLKLRIAQYPRVVRVEYMAQHVEDIDQAALGFAPPGRHNQRQQTDAAIVIGPGRQDPEFSRYPDGDGIKKIGR